jgi:hypothetical protein
MSQCNEHQRLAFVLQALDLSTPNDFECSSQQLSGDTNRAFPDCKARIDILADPLRDGIWRNVVQDGDLCLHSSSGVTCDHQQQQDALSCGAPSPNPLALHHVGRHDAVNPDHTIRSP